MVYQSSFLHGSKKMADREAIFYDIGTFIHIFKSYFMACGHLGLCYD